MTGAKSGYWAFSRCLSLFLVMLGLSACGGGGGGGTATPIAAAAVNSFTVQGSIVVSAGSIVDSDINNSSNSNISNNSPGEAQVIPSFAVLGGYVNQAMQGGSGPLFDSGDPSDYFSIYLYDGQSIVLDIHESADLDLYLLNSTGQIVFDSSVSTSSNESLLAPFEGSFQLLVEAFSGASNYTLRTEQTVNIDSSSFRLSDSFLPNELIVSYYQADMYKQQSENPDSTMNLLGLSLMAGQTNQVMRMSYDGYDSSQQIYNQALTLNESPDIYSRHQFVDGESEDKHETLIAIKMMNNDPQVRFAEPNLLIKATAIPNDPLYNEQWNYPLIELPAAWDLTTGSSDIIVAVVDSGALYQHPDLSGNLIAGYDFISEVDNALDGDGIDPNAEDLGTSYHGTHVAGIIAAQSNNGIGGSGISWQTSIMPLRVLGNSGGNLYDATQAIRYAAGISNDSGGLPAKTADIINLSIGGTGYCPSSYRDVLREVRLKDIIVVVAAGNDANQSNRFIPANCNDVIAVSAVDLNKQLTSYSNFGNSIDVAAPGGRDDIDSDTNGFVDAILSLSAEVGGGGLNYRYNYRFGTSMAAPHVSGVFALMLAVNPNLSAGEIEQMLISGLLTDDLGISGTDNIYGNGLINARKAVTAAFDSISGSPLLSSYLSSSISTVEFRPAQTEAVFETRTIGDSAITINSIDYAATWLNLVSLNQTSEAENWRLEIDRSGLTEGLYRETISFNSSVNTVNIEVILQVNAPTQRYQVGPVLVDLINTTTGSSVKVSTTFANSVYSFNFEGLVTGSYRINVYSDLNGNGESDTGEASAQSGIFTVNNNQTLTDLQLEWDNTATQTL
jgi:serine protease